MKDFYLYGSALVVIGGLAYWVSLPQEVSQGREWLDIDPSKMATLTYQKGDVKLVATKQSKSWWIDTGSEGFPSNESFERLLAHFHPWNVERVIGDEVELKEFGLDQPVATLEISDVQSASLLRLDFGKKAYGNQQLYIKHASTALLAGSAVLQRLDEPRKWYFPENFLKVNTLPAKLRLTAGSKSSEAIPGEQWKSPDGQEQTVLRDLWAFIEKAKVVRYLKELPASQPIAELVSEGGDGFQIAFNRADDGSFFARFIQNTYVAVLSDDVSKGIQDLIKKL